MRFMKGVVDSADLPLNISRETMQDSALIRKLGSVISKRVIKMFEKEAEADPEKYRGFYKKFDRFFKEGIATDYANREALAKLLRFESSLTEAGSRLRLRRLRLAGEGRAGVDLLSGRRQPRADREQSVCRGLQGARAGGGLFHRRGG